MRSPAHSRGVTLVELVVTIVIVAVAAAAVVAVLSATAVRGANDLVGQQAVLIGESYLSEILGKSFGQDLCYPGCARGSQMQKVGDYDRLLNVGVRDQAGNQIASLAGYTVQVSVTNNALGVIPPPQSQLVTVTVTAPTGAQVILSGYRTLYP